MERVYKNMYEASGYIKKVSNNFEPEAGLILGSGLGSLADEVENPIEISYRDIPHMKVSTVEGHAGKLVLGFIEGRKIMAFKGRIHYYEGYSMKNVTFPVRLMQALNTRNMVITNACGGINSNFKVGDLVILKDHINLMGDNPLIGSNDERLGPRFPDMSKAYDKDLINVATKACDKIGIKTLYGVYCGVPGPNFETFSEVKYISSIGADVVGMSTVPEVIVAAHAGIKTVGVSCVTDVIYKPGVEVSHEEVLEAAEKSKPVFMNLIREIIKNLPIKSCA